ncbi:hypothetical protein PRZ48_005252 [Zasmidium cellare]|uniref:Uncharacterized protein n=1 Tax=Zasmidium cellare TaxID=395010 RepID=A0ABR0ETB2_ZASCE|nr:hypothetical protein PRZ48_005252 [Zasmidium cellare]
MYFTHAACLSTLGRRRVVLVLQRLRHRPSELAAAIVSNLDDPTHHQRRAIRKWQDLKSRLEGNLNDANNPRTPTEREMQRLIDVISEIFFLGQLKHIKFVWKEGLETEDGDLGRISLPTAGLASRHWACIEVDPKDCRNLMLDHFTSLMGRLLHECIRAFLLVYSCNSACGNSTCEREIGKTGHGSAWLRIMSYVEAFVDEHLHRGVYLGIDEAIAVEYSRSGYAPTLQERALCHPMSHDALQMFAEDLAERN